MDWTATEYALSIAQAQCDAKQAEIRTLVRMARNENVPWSVIGRALGMSKQAAQQRYGK